PPTSTLFPYTTLFRSLRRRPFLSRRNGVRPRGRRAADAPQAETTRRRSKLCERERAVASRRHEEVLAMRRLEYGVKTLQPRALRSEEHTSELQSRGHL